MYKIFYSDKSYYQIENFVNIYKTNFQKLYTDTWIESEQMILKNYEELWDKFYSLIKIQITNKFIAEKILWKSETTTWLFMITLSVNNFKLFIHYKEDKKIKERYIENIEIYKK